MMLIQKLLCLITITIPACMGQDFLYHHQQHINQGNNGPDMRVEAIVQSKRQTCKKGYAFVANYCPMGVSKDNCPQTVLAQLGSNSNFNPFPIRWAKRYFDIGFNGGPALKLIVCDMTRVDIASANQPPLATKPGFLLCGEFVNDEDPNESGAFMMTLDQVGTYRQLAVYTSITTLKSCVEHAQFFLLSAKSQKLSPLRR